MTFGEYGQTTLVLHGTVDGVPCSIALNAEMLLHRASTHVPRSTQMLTPTEVVKIRRAKYQDGVTSRMLADRYRVSQRTIFRIWADENYRSLPSTDDVRRTTND